MAKFKIICVCILIIIIIVFFDENKQVNNENLIPQRSQQEEQQISKNFPNPDRIVYKLKGEDKYYIFTKYDIVYKELVAKISEMISVYDKHTAKTYLSKDELEQVQESGNYIMLDYDKVSKNYLFPIDNEYFGIIKLEDPIMVMDSRLENREEFKEYINVLTRNKESYYMGINKGYTSSNKLLEIPNEYDSKLIKYENDVNQFKIEDEKTLDKFIQDFNISINQELTEDIFDNSVIMATISKRNIELVTYEIGNMRYYFSNNTDEDYTVNLFVVSKVVNSNCVYRQFRNQNITYDSSGIVSKVSKTNIETDNKYEYKKNEIYEIREYSKQNIEINSEMDIRHLTKDSAMSVSKIKKGDLVIVYKTVPFLPNEEEKIIKIKVLPKAEFNSIISKEMVDDDRTDFWVSVLKAKADKNGNGTVLVMVSCWSEYISDTRTIIPFIAEFKINKDTKIEDGIDIFSRPMYECVIVLDKPITNINKINQTILRIEYTPC